MDDFARALVEFRGLLSPERVITDPDALRAAELATFITSQSIPAILRPRHRADVSAVLRIASRFKIPIYPSSRGKNWGLGSRVPARSGGLLLDLGDLDAILDYDEEMAYVTVEPGVTFSRLQRFLEEHGASLMMDGIGGPADASIVGNAVERGHGMGPWADRFSHICGAEVVLPDGAVIHTGFARVPGSRVAPLARWGVGPSVDGLFSQSNLGVVTALTLWLQPKPASIQAFAFRIDDDAQLAAVVEPVRRLRLGRIPVGLRILNDFRLYSVFYPCPWSRDDVRPLAERRGEIQQRGGIGRWTGIGVIHAPTPDIGLAFRAHVEALLAPHVAELAFEAPSRKRSATGDARSSEDTLFDLLFSGGASDGPLRMCYWRKESGAPTDRDVHRDACGVLWYCPTLPARSADVRSAVELIDRISATHGFEPNVGLISCSERVFDVTGALIFDRAVPGEDERALACHDELLRGLADAGFSPYRLGIQSMDLFGDIEPSSAELLRRLKRALDPDDILAPGRYDLRRR